MRDLFYVRSCGFGVNLRESAGLKSLMPRDGRTICTSTQPQKPHRAMPLCALELNRADTTRIVHVCNGNPTYGVRRTGTEWCVMLTSRCARCTEPVVLANLHIHYITHIKTTRRISILGQLALGARWRLIAHSRDLCHKTNRFGRRWHRIYCVRFSVYV